MKRITTLLFALGSFVLVQAQSSKTEEARRIIRNEPRTAPQDRRVYEERYPDNNGVYSSGSTEAERINREYDQKVQSIRNNPYLSTEEKNRAIRQLNQDRARRLREVNNDRDRRYDDDDDDDRYKKDKKGKSNNGKHKGWTQGKGNQKKNKH